MKKPIMKTTLTVITLVAFNPALAEVNIAKEIESFNVATLDTSENLNTELAFAFDSTDTIQATTMTDNEMQETEGAVAPIVIRVGGGALIGGGYEAWDSYSKTGRVDWNAVGQDAAMGVFGGGTFHKITKFTGNPGHWVRVHNSYSKVGQFKTTSVAWGSNAHHRKSISNETIRSLNKNLRETKLPGNSWRLQDKGHFHLYRHKN